MEELNKSFKIFKSLFNGRDDVFAVRWEKGGKSGYMPAYDFDPYQYRLHKIKGGTFQNFTAKTHKPLADAELFKHLEGQQLIGVYPLLEDNTSWFIAADFDKDRWEEDAVKFVNICLTYKIPAYLERSRSGNGAHVWIFFDQPYEAYKSRKIFISLLQECGVVSKYDKASSFDRLFPNQDRHTGKGLGNLIALPLHKPAMVKGNSCFLNIDTFEPFLDQWRFLETVQTISAEALKRMYEIVGSNNAPTEVSREETGEQLIIQLSNIIQISRNVPLALAKYLKEELSIASSEFIIKKKHGKNTWGTERCFRMIEDTENGVIIPRGFVGKMLRFCRVNKIDHRFEDLRRKRAAISFTSTFELRDYQKLAFDAAVKKDFGVIVAPPGSGKTVLALALLAQKQQPTLIVVHRKQLADQWAERIEQFLGIPGKEIGKMGQGKNKTGKQITIAMVQSLEKVLNGPDAETFQNCFGTIIIDECHHVPAKTFRKTITAFHTYYLYGLTATPFRKYNDGKLIFTFLGDVIADIKPLDIPDRPAPKIVIRNTNLAVPFNSKTDKFETLSKILIHDTSRNNLILHDVMEELRNGKKVALLTERKEHIDSLAQFLKHSFEIITLSGEDTEATRKSKWKLLNDGSFQVLITTGQYFGEGTDLHNINCLFLAYPFSFEGKLIQYIGRVQRSEIAPVIYDYRDSKIAYLERLFKKRNSWYRKLQKERTLFDQPEEIIRLDPFTTETIEKLVKVPLGVLVFKFGAASFQYGEGDSTIELEVENEHIRPEFEVLKPYFARALDSKKVSIDLTIVLENGKVVSGYATSSDIEKINKEIIEGVKFQFITKHVFRKGPDGENNLFDLHDLQQTATTPLFDTEEALLDALLIENKSRHFLNLRYLASRHERSILKVRFVLLPFSFIFLISGAEKYHVIWETLDTEEATYLWHIPKNRRTLAAHLKMIDKDLGNIRSNGRQAFMEAAPSNFSRIVHDYTDKRKGFVVWKDQLEERLI